MTCGQCLKWSSRGARRALQFMTFSCKGNPVAIAQPIGQCPVVGLEYHQHASEHLLDEIGQANGFAGSVANGQCRRIECGRVEIARPGRVIGIGPPYPPP